MLIMSAERKEMEQIVDSPSDDILRQMEKDKFYTTSEMSELLFEKKLFTKDALKAYVSAQYKNSPSAPVDEVFAAIVPYLRDLAYVEAFLWTHLAAGKLILGFKKGQVYYAKRT
jgi:hypothetical protein